MKRNLGILAGMAALALAVYLGNWARAQQNYAQQRAPLQTRIAIVNLSQVIKNYKKYQSFEEELKQQSKGVQQALDGRKAQAIAAQKEMEQPTITAERKDQLERDIKRLQRETQDSVEDAKQKMAKREFDELVQIYKEIKDAVDAYARAYAIELVMQYQDAVGPDVYSPPHFNQKLLNRACIPIYVDPRIDITEPVTAMLNQKLASAVSQAPRGQ